MKKFSTVVCAVVFSTSAFAQDDLMKELEQTQPKDTDYAFQTFKGTRLVNGHSVETKAKNTLEFIFQHRFGPINGGAYEMYGLDQAYVRLGLDYGITDNLSVSIGRNSFDKTMDSYAKYKLIRQSKGARNFPVTMTALGGIAYKTSPKKEDAQDGFENIDRLAYVSQLMIARKFTPKFSFQITPTFIHKNFVDDNTTEHNDQVAIGAGGRFKVSKSIALTGEYYYRLNTPDGDPNYNSLGFGVDIETGGHVFQLVITNTETLTERAFITETKGKFADGGIHFGFNVTRTFQLKKKH
jgi:hypothetical protein